MLTDSSDTNTPVLVDFSLAPGAYDVGIASQDIAQKSTEALEKAMQTIRQMGNYITTTIQAMSHRPSQVEIEFGIVLNAEMGALISKVGMEASINVKMTFDAHQHEEKISAK